MREMGIKNTFDVGVKIVMCVFLNSACNFSYGRFVFGGYFATEENEEKRGIRGKIFTKESFNCGVVFACGFWIKVLSFKC